MLVERSAEFSLLKQFLADCLDGAGGLAVISGPVGAGKTELLRSLAQAAVEEGALFLGADAFRAERSVPLGVLSQVFAAPDLPPETAESASRLLEDGLLSASLLGDWDDEMTERAVAPFLHKLTSILLELSESRPLVIGIDDVHFADIASLRCVLYLIHRIGKARVLVVVSESSTVRQPWPLLWAELLSQPCCRHVRLGLLSPDGVAAVLADHPNLPGTCEPLICYQVTGGNPRLLMALLEDYRAAPGQNPAPAVGTVFGQSILTCFFRSDATLPPIAWAVAVLDDSVTPALLSELLEMGDTPVMWAVEAATEAGLLEGGRFRHDQARLAALGAISEQERAELHKRAAQLLYRSGASAVAIARHEIAAHHADMPWSAPVLCEAAEQALDEDDVSFASASLRLAERGVADEAQHARIRSGIVRVKWRLDPASAERDIWELLHAARAGHLCGQNALALVNHLLWNGRPAEAAEILGQVGGRTSAGDSEIAATMYSTGLRLAYTYPALFGRDVGGAVAPPPGLSTTSGKLHIRGAGIIGTLLTEGFTENALEDAQGVLQQSRLSEHTYEPILAALETMVLADCLDKAAFWCDALLRQAEERRMPTLGAHLSGIRAMISFRQGKLAEATRHGRAALSRIPPRGFGVFIGVPLSILLLVAVRRGHYEEALNHLSVPVPDAMFETPIGLHYLRARGRYYLALRCYKGAIEDFEACGDLMVKWGLDLPGIVPWRTDLAEANLQIGAPAKDLALDQLARLGSYNERTRGISLRVLAAASELRQRPSILRKAVEMLHNSGDQLELGDALADLSNAQYALGEYTKARLTGRRARQLAIRTNPAEVRSPGSADTREQGAPLARLEEDPEVFKLSDAERRVVSLAVQGYTNRQIAGKLYIAVSTVEQHLTRVYKKLQISRRADLPFALSSNLGRPA